MGNTPCRDHLGRSSGLVLGTFRKPGCNLPGYMVMFFQDFVMHFYNVIRIATCLGFPSQVRVSPLNFMATLTSCRVLTGYA